ncbi:hypothetical protein CPB83DRAFT_254539 [Crepidotus variabilis]|uniref:F-box domain-containing protein n=1 Tax=Crepidotus variabilis TaxID=179855 RepID=A0A9P6EJ23_9AGAR|nr:hypothetical protein CPB83DRAFT_254539 [Crepidotus variabilis]
MSLLQLPAELVDAVLSYLWAEEDRVSLWECSLTCKALVSPAQAYIFRNLKLTMPSPDVPAILEYRVHIRPLIQHLELVELHKPWIQRDKTTHRTFELLSSYITSLKIFQRRQDIDRPRFELSCLSQLKSLEKIFLSEELRGGNFGKPMHGDVALITLLNHFPNLRAIDFHSCLVPNQIIDKSSQKAPPIFHLEALKIRLCQDSFTLNWLIPATASLRNLHFRVPPAEEQPIFWDILERVIEVSAGSLEHLTIRDVDLILEANRKSLMTKIHLHGAALRSMSLVIGTVGVEAVHQLSFIAHCLHTIETLPQLRHLTLGLYGRVKLEDIYPNDLETLLVGNNFPVLCNVDICPSLVLLNLAERSSPDVFFAAFPQLVQRRMLSVRFTGEFDWH